MTQCCCPHMKPQQNYNHGWKYRKWRHRWLELKILTVLLHNGTLLSVHFVGMRDDWTDLPSLRHWIQRFQQNRFCGLDVNFLRLCVCIEKEIIKLPKILLTQNRKWISILDHNLRPTLKQQIQLKSWTTFSFKICQRNELFCGHLLN